MLSCIVFFPHWSLAASAPYLMTTRTLVFGWSVHLSPIIKTRVCYLATLNVPFNGEKLGFPILGRQSRLLKVTVALIVEKFPVFLNVGRSNRLLAKDARRIDVLCYRISLSCRLLDGTSKFKELHQIISDAKAKLETEVGPVIGDSAKMPSGIVSRLLVATDVQNLCFLAMERADACLRSISNVHLNHSDVWFLCTASSYYATMGNHHRTSPFGTIRHD